LSRQNLHSVRSSRARTIGGWRPSEVWVLKRGDPLLATFSKFAAKTFDWQGHNNAERVEFLLSLADSYPVVGWVLIPTDDEAVSLLSQHHDVLAGVYRLTTPPWRELRVLVGKWLLHQLAGGLEIPQLWTRLPKNGQELRSLNHGFLVILKPRSRDIANRFTNTKAWLLNDEDSLLVKYIEVSALLPSDSVMVQEHIPGGTDGQFSSFALCQEGRVLTFVTARRSRQWPMDFGRASSFVETVDLPEIIEPSCRILRATRFTGIV